MLDLPALDVAIGLVFVYFVLALVCSAINEGIASYLHWRAKDLERGLQQLLGQEEERFREHPLIASQVDPSRRGSAYPSYISSRTFATALLGLDYAADTLQGAGRTIDESLAKIDDPRLKAALTALYHRAQRDAVAFRQSVEQWYDDAMERVSGWYRRRVQKVLIVLSVLVAFLLNADTLQISKGLWKDPSVRSALVKQAGNAQANESKPVTNLKKLPVPLGWHLASGRHDPQGFPIYHKPSMVWALIAKLIGLLLTAVALTLGAPFWFDTLSKLARLRNSGAPPPASDAVRRGEGEEARAGPSTILVQAAPASAEAGPSPPPQAGP